MKETEGFPQEEKLNNESPEADLDLMLHLEAALERTIDDLDQKSEEDAFSEFDEDEEDWNPLRRRKNLKESKEKERSKDKGDSQSDEDSQNGEDSRKDDDSRSNDGARSDDDSWDDDDLDDDSWDDDDLDDDSWDDDDLDDDDSKDDDDSEDDNHSEKAEASKKEDDPAANGDSSSADEDEEDDEYELDDEEEEYLRSAAFKRRAKRVVTPEMREKRRRERIARFWDMVYRRRKQVYWGLVGLIVCLVAAASMLIVRNWTYHSYKELVASVNEDTLSASYANINGRILKYSVDGAMLADHNNDMLWTVSYEMNAPEVVLCEDTFAIFDSKGAKIVICNTTGKIGEVTADKPIVKVKIGKQGMVAAILEDGQNAWIKCYSKDGTEIATLKTTFTNPGYPMDIALSPTGTLLAVNYLFIDQGTPVSRVSFYNFGKVGQNQKDNLVAETEYRDKIFPEVDYMDDKTCVVFGEDGFSLFSGGQIPSEDVKVKVDENIVSTFHDSENVGLVLQNRGSDKEYRILVYNKRGKEILNKEMDFRYQSVQLNGSQIVFSSKNEFCVYSLQGVEKFRGDLEAPASEFIGFGRNKYLYVTEDLFKIIQLS